MPVTTSYHKQCGCGKLLNAHERRQLGHRSYKTGSFVEAACASGGERISADAHPLS